MGNTTKSGIWTPDEDDQLDPDVWSATMAQSIEDGIGKRLDKQEARVSLRATTPEPFDVVGTVVTNAYKRVPLNANGPTGSRAPEPDFAGGNHAQGVKIEGDAAIILTDGLYTLQGQCTFTAVGGHAFHSWDFYGTVNGVIFGLPDYGTTGQAFAGGRVNDTRYLVAGDRIELIVGVGTDHIGSFRVQDALLAVSMVYAT